MASFGQGIRPELGAIDYSPYLRGAQQGAQSMQRGMEQMGQGIAQGIEKGIEKYKDIQKQNKEKDATVKSTIKFLESFQDMPNMSPEFKKVTLDALGSLHDPKASRDDLFAISQNAGKQLNMVMSMGQQGIANKQAQDELDIKRMNAKAQQDQVKAEMMRSYFANQPKIAADPDLVGSAEWKRKQDVALAQTAAERAAVTQDLAESKQNAAEERLKAKDVSADRKFLAAAESRKAELINTIKYVRKAKDLVSRNVGGRLGGSVVGQWLSEDSQTLASHLDTIKANLRLSKMAELKALSANGSTGFGPQSDKEGAVMEDYSGKIHPNQPEPLNFENLDNIQKLIQKQLDNYNPSEGFINSTTKVLTWNPAKGIFE